MNYKYFALNSNPNKKLSVKQIAINAIIILSNLILLSCIFSIPIATYYNYDKLDSSLEIKVKFRLYNKVFFFKLL